MISLERVSVEIDGRFALCDVSLETSARRIAVIGANGSGKSTLARVIAGLTRISTGTVRVHGLDPSKDAAALRSLVGVVFSNPDAQIVMPTVEEDVALSLRSLRLPKAEVAVRTATTLRELGLEHLATRASHELSGGQKQLLALASVVVREPALIIADEPTAYLDARNARVIASRLLGFDKQVIIVTHDLALASQCDQAILCESGVIAEVGAPSDVIARYERSLS